MFMAVFDTINCMLHNNGQFIVILVQSLLKHFFQKKIMLVNLHILDDAETTTRLSNDQNSSKTCGLVS